MIGASPSSRMFALPIPSPPPPPPSSKSSIAVSVNSWSIESTDSVSFEELP